MQIWHLTPRVQKEVRAALRDLGKLQRPTIAFHVRGGDAGGEEELLFDVRPCRIFSSENLAVSERACPSAAVVYMTCTLACVLGRAGGDFQ